MAKRWFCVVGAVVALLWPAPAATAAEAAQPPKLDVHAATAALATESIYRAPGAVAQFDETAVGKALASSTKVTVKVLVAPYTGQFAKGNNYASDDQYVTDVYTPLEDWADANHVQLIDVTGLYASIIGTGAFTPSDIPELRTQTAYQDVTSALLGAINYLQTGQQHYADTITYPIVAPTAAQVAALTARLRANPVYNAPGRTDPIGIDTGYVTRMTGFTIRVAMFPALPPGTPLVDYAPALAKQFPDDEIFVCYGQWMDVAGPHQAALESARDYAYGQYLDATLEQGADMTDRIGTIVARTYDLVRKHPFGRPEPTPFDLRHEISAISPWVLLGSAVLLGGGSLFAWQRHRADAARREKVALQRESALATAAIAGLGARVLDDRPGHPAVAERYTTVTTLFEQAGTADAMREVRTIAEEALHS